MITLSFFIGITILAGTASLYIKDINFKLILALMIALGYAIFWSQQPIGMGHDIDRYYAYFLKAPDINEYSLTTNYGHFYSILVSLAKTIGFNFRVFLFFMIFMSMSLYVFSFRLLTKNYVFALSVLVLLVDIFIATVRVQRQGIAVVFLFLAFAYLFKNKKAFSFLLLPIAGSLHLTSLPFYVFIIAVKSFLRRSIVIKTIAIILIVSLFFYITKNLNLVIDIIDLFQDDSRYFSRISKYIANADTESGLNVGFLLMVFMAMLSVVHTYFLSKNNRGNIYLNIYVSLVLFFSLILRMMTAELEVISRINLYFSPFYALGLTLIIDRLSGYNRLVFVFSSLMVLGSFFWLRVLVRDISRVWFY